MLMTGLGKNKAQLPIAYYNNCSIFFSGKATFYDYGEEKNTKIYGQAAAPEIDLKTIKNTLNIFYCESDHLASPQVK